MMAQNKRKTLHSNYFLFVFLGWLVLHLNSLRSVSGFTHPSNSILYFPTTGTSTCTKDCRISPDLLQFGCFLQSPSSLLSSSSSSYSEARNDDDDDDDDDDDSVRIQDVAAVNVLGTDLECCCADVRETGIGTGFYRNGYCSTGVQDVGRHTVCVEVTKEFLHFSTSVGNDLSTPMPAYNFPGLQPGDCWCLCAQRFAEAVQSNKAPPVWLRATHEKTLTYVPFEVLRTYALDGPEADTVQTTLNSQRQHLEQLLVRTSTEEEEENVDNDNDDE